MGKSSAIPPVAGPAPPAAVVIPIQQVPPAASVLVTKPAAGSVLLNQATPVITIWKARLVVNAFATILAVVPVHPVNAVIAMIVVKMLKMN